MSFPLCAKKCFREFNSKILYITNHSTKQIAVCNILINLIFSYIVHTVPYGAIVEGSFISYYIEFHCLNYIFPLFANLIVYCIADAYAMNFFNFSFYSHSKSEPNPFFSLVIHIETEVQSIHKHNANTSSPHLISENITMTTTCFTMYNPCSNFTSHIRAKLYYIRIQINAYLLCITFDWISVYITEKVSRKKIWYAWGSTLYEGLLKSIFDILQYLHHLWNWNTPVLRLCSETHWEYKWKVLHS